MIFRAVEAVELLHVQQGHVARVVRVADAHHLAR